MLLLCKKMNTTRKAIYDVLRKCANPDRKESSIATWYTVNWTLLRDIFRTVMKRYYIASFWSCLLVVSILAQIRFREKSICKAGHFVGDTECVELFEFFERWIEYNLSYEGFLLPTKFKFSVTFKILQSHHYLKYIPFGYLI